MLHFDHILINLYQLIKISSNSDGNLRSHLGRVHNMPEMLFESQHNQSATNPKQIKSEKKREFYEAAIDCIITNGCPFDNFHRLGMSNFLNIICPG